MKRVELRMNEQYKYETIKKLADGKINKTAATVRLNLTTRSINRLLNNYKLHGKNTFMHGNRSIKPSNTIALSTKDKILSLYKTTYANSNFKHFTELLAEHEDIHVSHSFIKKLMKDNEILSPKAHRKTKKKLMKLQFLRDKQNFNDNQINEIVNHEIALEDAHPRRERAKYEGELTQLDASHHVWFGNCKSHLHAAIDDATGKIVGMYFDWQETLVGYYNVYHQILTTYGIPYEFLTDKRTVFEYKKKNEVSLQKDTFTQFSYAAHQLGTAITTSSVPQAKGRVERLFGTLQSRLIIELRIRNITTIEEANAFIPTFIKKYNQQFALQLDDNTNVYESIDISSIDYILSVLSPRKIDNGNCLSYNNQYYYPVGKDGRLRALRPKTSVMVIQTFKGDLFVSSGDDIYPLKLLNKNKKLSSEFDIIPNIDKVGTFTPAMNHPWKQESFKKYYKKKAKLSKSETEQVFG